MRTGCPDLRRTSTGELRGGAINEEGHVPLQSSMVRPSFRKVIFNENSHVLLLQRLSNVTMALGHGVRDDLKGETLTHHLYRRTCTPAIPRAQSSLPTSYGMFPLLPFRIHVKKTEEVQTPADSPWPPFRSKNTPSPGPALASQARSREATT